MKILILGGTRFVGRAIVEACLARGHELTLVHRGQTGEGIFDGRVRTVRADRLADLSSLAGGSWDACIDTCAYVPRAISMSRGVLAGSVNHYILISTISVYKDPLPGADENAPLIEDGDPNNEVIDADSYGYLKVLCEREVHDGFGPGSCILRPGIVIGPNDPTDRFTYWVARIGSEPKVVVPAGPDRPVQWIDARDLANFCLTCAENTTSGTYNVVGPSCTLREMHDELRNALNPGAEFVKLDLAANGIEPWSDLPMVVGPDDGAFQISNDRARKAGLTTRALRESATDTLAWWRAQGRDLKVGLDAERHAMLIAP